LGDFKQETLRSTNLTTARFLRKPKGRARGRKSLPRLRVDASAPRPLVAPRTNNQHLTPRCTSVYVVANLLLVAARTNNTFAPPRYPEKSLPRTILPAPLRALRGRSSPRQEQKLSFSSSPANKRRRFNLFLIAPRPTRGKN
jgi:hypothetical protein